MEVFDDSAHGSPYDDADSVSTRLAVEVVLLELDAPDRELLRLRYEEDLTYAEIARRLRTPVGTAKVRLHRLKERLRTRLIEAECR